MARGLPDGPAKQAGAHVQHQCCEELAFCSLAIYCAA